MKNGLYITGIRLDGEIPKENYIAAIPVVKHLKELEINKSVIFLVGENGTGKSTFLEAVAVNYGFNPEGGSRNFTFSTRATHSDLYKYITVCKGISRPKDGFFLRAESLYNVATNIDKLDSEPSFDSKIIEGYGGRSLHDQSHGESFSAIIHNRFFGNGLYILDEPEAALSPIRQLSLLSKMNELVKEKSQFIIATHSPIIMAYPDADIYVLSEEGITITPYRETEHYRITKEFLDSPERMFRYLF
ncbi:MAG: AAA family ATPase [Eubacteriales bacterium]|nr:AAA family ATPase [Eubacteriales bacterium]